MSHTDVPPSSKLWADLLPGTGAGRIDDGDNFRRSLSRQRRFPLRADPARDDGGAGASNSADQDQGPVSRGWGHAPGGGGADGSALRQARGRGDIDGPNFNLDVP